MSGVGTTCSYIQVQPDNGCWALADRCGISQDDLVTYNPADGFCDNLLVDQYVCCSEGDLPDFSPKPDDDGNCFVYTVQDGDLCSTIAKANQMDADKIPDYNKLTWGWMGCNNLQKYGKICLSEGTPPFPSPVEGNVCGPQVPDTEQPSTGTTWDWAELNPCPLNACCNMWGQCGITPEFCTNTTEEGGAPGTAKKDTNGCISNCGTEVKSSDSPVDTPRRIGYFEAWNKNRPCANMDVSKMTEDDTYTHVHWAFGNLTDDWQVDVSGQQEQFDGLLKLEGIKRIMSFGGWGFSTEASTHLVFRNGVKDGNRQVFAKNVVDFIVEYDLEGVDFDWEYPGAQDLPVGPDSLDSGKNYAEFLKLVRAQLPEDKSVSMALPASFWYLKGFDPVTQYDDYIDYYVFMTYDLHGQWDAENEYANEGCPTGNCLRSHVNKTETEFTLAMITKAGISSTKIVPGLALYGRSFEMTDPSCKGPECTFTGTRTESNAAKGSCTDTGGYLSNVEIRSIMNQADGENNISNITYEEYEDEGDIIIYNGNQWVAWLTPESYESRRSWYDDMHFGGSVDWAVDLDRSYANNGEGDLESDEDWPDPELCPTTKYSTLHDLQEALDGTSIPNRCIAYMTLDTLVRLLDDAWDAYNDVNNGYDEMFDYYVKYIEKVVPSVLEHAFMFNTSITEDPDYAVPKPGDGMRYFDCGYLGDNWDNCYKIFEENTRRRSLSLPASEDDDAANLTSRDTLVDWEMRMTDEDGYDAALAHAGLLPDWVDMGDFTLRRMNYDTTLDLYWQWIFSPFPIKNESMEVQNPKDIVTEGLPNLPALREDMVATKLEILVGAYFGGDPRDAALAYAPAVFMLQQAVDSMRQAKELGEQEEEEEEEEERKRKENFILLIISVVLIFVPIVGQELAAAAGLANLARVIAIAGELANAALATYDTVKDPGSAVINMLGMVFGLGSIAKVARDGPGLAQVAKWRRGMSAAEITSLGKIFKDGDDLVQSVLVKVCKL